MRTGASSARQGQHHAIWFSTAVSGACARQLSASLQRDYATCDDWISIGFSPGMTVTSALNRPHILIVSDDTGLSSFLGEGLMIAGFWTSTVASALQAIEVFRLRTFDLIIVDAALDGL